MFRRRHRPGELARIDADITAFGEELARHELVPSGHSGDELLLVDYGRALDAYEQAKRDVVGDRDREDAEDVLRALDEGRHALACVDARLAGRPVPSRHPLCFFDPRHGVSTTDVTWTPPEGTARVIAVCSADAVRITDGLAPMSTGRGPGRAAEGTDGQGLRDGRRPDAARRPAATSPASAQPSPLSSVPKTPGAWRPYKTWPPGTPKGQRAEVRDTSSRTEIGLLPPDPGALALLAIRAVRGSVGTVDILGGPARRRVLKNSKAPGLVLPLPVDGKDYVQLALQASGHLQLWTQSLDLVPVLGTGLSSVGGFVFRHIGGPVAIQVSRQGGRGVCRIHALSEGLATGEEVLAAEGDAVVRGRLPGPGLYIVGATVAQWRITIAP